MKINKIYTLKDPFTNSVRYVGITTQDLNKRLKQHINKSKNIKKKTHNHCWINSLLIYNKEPIIELVEILDTLEELKEREKYWIKYYNSIEKLTNITEGGDGINGYKWAENEIIKRSKSVCQYDKEGNLINTYSSISNAAEAMGNRKMNGKISGVCKGIYGRKTFKGFIWRYENDSFDKIDWKIDNSIYKNIEYREKIKKRQTGKTNSFSKQILQYDLNYNFIKEFDTITLVCKNLNIKGDSWLRHCIKNNKPFHGFYWKIKNKI